jgi:hypothetical protein
MESPFLAKAGSMLRLTRTIVLALSTSACIPSWVVNSIAAGNPGVLSHQQQRERE